EDDLPAHLAAADAAVDEDDGDLLDRVAALQGPVRELDLEGVPARAHARKINVFEDLPAKAFEAAGQVADRDAEDDARVEAAAFRQQAAAEAPVHGAAAFDVAAAEDEVGAFGLAQHRRED